MYIYISYDIWYYAYVNELQEKKKYEKSWWQSISTWSNLSGCEQYESNQIGLVWCTLWAIVTGCFINNLHFWSYTNYANVKVLLHPVKCFASGYPSQNWAMYTPNKRWWMRDQVWIHTDNKCEVFFPTRSCYQTFFSVDIYAWYSFPLTCHRTLLKKSNPFHLRSVKNWSDSYNCLLFTRNGVEIQKG